MTRRQMLAASVGLVVAAGLSRREARAQAGASKAKIGIIGAGHIGGTVGSLWVKAGHEVLFSSRHPEELAGLVGGLGPLAHTGTPDQAIAFGDVVFLAVPYNAYPEIGATYGKALTGKVVLDAGNATAARDGALADEAKTAGIGVTSAKYLPGTRLVRAFNVLNYKLLADEAHRTGEPVAIPIAGNDAGALDVASGLVRDAGFEPVVVGDLAKASAFQMGAPGYGQNVTASELRNRLGLAP